MSDQSPQAWPIVIPRENVNDEFVILLRWLVPDGGRVEAGAPLFDIETSKAAVEVPAENTGYVVHRAKESDQVAVGGCIGAVATDLGDAALIEAAISSLTAASVPEPNVLPSSARDLVSPSNDEPESDSSVAGVGTQRWSKRAKELAARHNLDVAAFAGRLSVRERDVQSVLDARTGREVVFLDARVPRTEPVQPPARSGRAAVVETHPLSSLKRAEVHYLGSTARSGILPSAVTVAVSTAALDSTHRVGRSHASFDLPGLRDSGSGPDARGLQGFQCLLLR